MGPLQLTERHSRSVTHCHLGLKTPPEVDFLGAWVPSSRSVTHRHLGLKTGSASAFTSFKAWGFPRDRVLIYIKWFATRFASVLYAFFVKVVLV